MHHEISADALAALKQAVPDYADAIHHPERAISLQTLERGRDGEVMLALFPANVAELQAAITILNQHRLPSTTIGGGTGLVEAQRTQGILISTQHLDRALKLTLQDSTVITLNDLDISSRYEDRIKHWSKQLQNVTKDMPPKALHGATLTVEAGVPIDAINGRPSTAAEPGGYPGILQTLGLKVPIVMGSSAAATAGACAANGSAGANAIRYGTAADMAVRIKGVLGNGHIVEQKNPGRDSVGNDSCIIRSDRFLYGDSLIGSQGSFGIITEVEYKTWPVAQEQVMTLLPVPDMATAFHILKQAQEYFMEDSAVELFEMIKSSTLEKAQTHAGQKTHAANGLPYYVMMQVVSEETSPDSELFPGHSQFFEKVGMFLIEGLKVKGSDAPLYPHGNEFDYDEQPQRLMAIREACSDMSRHLEKQAYDVVVPLTKLETFVAELETALAKEFPDLQLEWFGHAGVGALHLHVLGALGNRTTDIDRCVFDLVVAQGGSPWAEHGIGHKWVEAWQHYTPHNIQDTMQATIYKYDPNNVIGSALFKTTSFPEFG